MREWAEDEVNFLIQNYKRLTIEQIAFALHRTYFSVSRKLQRLHKKGRLALDMDADVDLSSIEPDFWAWFTGFWEGEGYIIKQKVINNKEVNGKVYRYPGTAYAFGLAQKNRDVLEYIQRRLGGYIHKKHKSDCYEWKVYRKGKICKIVSQMMPYLRFRKKHILEVLST